MLHSPTQVRGDNGTQPSRHPCSWCRLQYIHTHIHTHTHTYIHTYIHTYTHTNTNTHTHTHTHTHTSLVPTARPLGARSGMLHRSQQLRHPHGQVSATVTARGSDSPRQTPRNQPWPSTDQAAARRNRRQEWTSPRRGRGLSLGSTVPGPPSCSWRCTTTARACDSLSAQWSAPRGCNHGDGCADRQGHAITRLE